VAQESGPILLGYLLAFLTAATVVFFDLYTNLAKSISRVPGAIVTHPAILGLCALCGSIAAFAYGFTDPAGGDAVSTAITLQVQNPWRRGLVVGATVLVLLRSKLFNIQDTEIGGELVYTRLRSLALQAVNDHRTRGRNRFLTANINAAFAIPTYFTQLEAQIASSIAARSRDYQKRVRDQITASKRHQPREPMDKNNPSWEIYYRSLTGICFDYCGPKILLDLDGFRLR